MAKYYKTHKKRIKPHAFHWFDIVVMAAVVWLITQTMPVGIVIDFSAGLIGPSQAYLEVESERITEQMSYAKVGHEYFEDIFRSSGVQKGSRVYPINKKAYFVYTEDDEGRKYYSVVESKLQGRVLPDIKGDVEPGFIGDGAYVSIQDDGRLFYADDDGDYGLTDIYIDLNSEPDYAAVHAMLNIGYSQTIEMGDAAYIYSLIQRGILIGYQDGVAWFRDIEDGAHVIYRADENGVERVGSLSGEVQNVFVASNRFMIYQRDGDVNYYNFDTEKAVCFGIPDFADFGALQDIAYCVRDNGDVLICGYAEHALFYYLISYEDGSCYKQTRISDFPDGEITGIFATNFDSDVIWVEVDGNYLRYVID